MASMAPIRNFSGKVDVTIDVDGKALEEYIRLDVREHAHRTVCYVEAQQGQIFSIKQVIKKDIIFQGDAIYGETIVDGEKYDHFYLHPDKEKVKTTTIDGASKVEKINTIAQDYERVVTGPCGDKTKKFCFNGIDSGKCCSSSRCTLLT